MASYLLSGLEMLQANINGKIGILKCSIGEIILKKSSIYSLLELALVLATRVLIYYCWEICNMFFSLLFNSTKFYLYSFILRLSECQKSRKKRIRLPLRSYRQAGIFPTYCSAGRGRGFVMTNCCDLKFIGFNIITLESLPQRFSINSG